MSRKKVTTPKIDRRTAANIEVTRKDALMLFAAVNDSKGRDDAQVDILGHVDDVTESARPDYSRDKTLFVRYLLEGWPHASKHTRINVGDIIQRLRAGHTLEEIHNYFEEMHKKNRAEQEEKERKAPEPKNWLSREWRWWKIRQLTRALNGDDQEAFFAAGTEFKALLQDLVRDGNIYHVSFVLALLPDLLVIKQDIAQMMGQPKSAKLKPAYFTAKKGGARR